MTAPHHMYAAPVIFSCTVTSVLEHQGVGLLQPLWKGGDREVGAAGTGVVVAAVVGKAAEAVADQKQGWQ